MSYFMVPSVSYQTQQQLEKQQKEKGRRAKRKKKHGSSGSESTRSSGGSKHSHDTIGELPDVDDNRSILSSTSVMTKHSSRPGTSRSSSSFKPLTQLKEGQKQTSQPSSPQLPQQKLHETDNYPLLSRKSIETLSVVEQEFTRPPDFEQSAQFNPVEQQVSRETVPEINEQASMIASRYGQALRSGSTKTPVTPVSGSFSKYPSLDNRRSGSAISNTSVPSGHFNQNQVFQRNSSASSGLSQESQYSAPHSSKDNLSFRKLSFLGSSGKRRGSTVSLPGTIGSPGSSNKQDASYFPENSSNTTSPSPGPTSASQSHISNMSFSYGTQSPQPPSSLLAMKVIPPFNVNTDLSVYNTRESLERTFVSPNYLVFRFNSFLDLLSEHHSTDAIGISSIRYHLLLKFISKQKNAKDFIRKGNKLSFGSPYGLTMADSVLAYHLYGPMRGILRELIRMRLNDHGWKNHEELVQCNFINFVRYVATLPDNANPAELNDIEKKIYEFKEVFNQTANAMYLLKKEQATESDSADIAEFRFKLLIETITKVCYEYLLLEKYRLDITTKYNNNHLIDKQILKKLFYKYEANIRSGNRENVKVFVYNTSYLIQYSWYVALSMPFLRVLESHVYTEDKNLIQDLEQYRRVEMITPKMDFTASEQELFDTFTKKLSFGSFSEYNNTTMDKLVKLHRSIDNQSPKYAKINRHELPDPASNYSFRPMNFEYYNSSMATLRNESFELILTPDLILQATEKTYRTLVSECYRILKPGGTLVIDSIQFGAKNPQEFLERYKDGRFPEVIGDEDLGLLKYFDAIPNFTETILKELSLVFGKNNVQFSVTLLSSSLDVNSFSIKFVGMRLFEIVGKVDEYCDSFTETGENFKSESNESIHFSIHIRASKSS